MKLFDYDEQCFLERKTLVILKGEASSHPPTTSIPFFQSQTKSLYTPLHSPAFILPPSYSYPPLWASTSCSSSKTFSVLNHYWCKHHCTRKENSTIMTMFSFLYGESPGPTSIFTSKQVSKYHNHLWGIDTSQSYQIDAMWPYRTSSVGTSCFLETVAATIRAYKKYHPSFQLSVNHYAHRWYLSIALNIVLHISAKAR